MRPDKGLTFMHSYPNLIPLDAATVRRHCRCAGAVPFETIYGGWWDRVIPVRARQVMADSVAQYLRAVGGEAGGRRDALQPHGEEEDF